MKENLRFAFSTLVLASLLVLQACDGGYYYGGGHHHGGGHWGGYPGGGHHGGGHWGGYPGSGHRGGGHWGGYPGGGHRGGRHLMESEDSSPTALINQESDAVDPSALLAQDYSIKLGSAQAFIQLASGQKTTEAAAAMGVGLFDLTSLSKLEMPSSETLDQIARTLGEDRSTIEKLMADFIQDIRAANLNQSQSEN